MTISAGFQGQKLKLKDIGVIQEGFELASSVLKVQGHEGLVMRVTKSASTDILSGQKSIVSFFESFRKANPDSPVEFVLIDDESYDVRNRLELIGSNGLIGFILIVLILFLFLDFRSGVWVAMGIPFSLSFTLIFALLMGYSINNMTLAAIIIVLGIVVDDAIIVAENISSNTKGKDQARTVSSVVDVGAPVLASVLTTCAAFIPLYFFSGRLGLFVKYIPAIIFLMLAASLIESFFMLPTHMTRELWIEKVFKKYFPKNNFAIKRAKIVAACERKYTQLLEVVLSWRLLVLAFFVILLGLSTYLFMTRLNYVMFPREESRDFRLQVIAAPEIKRYDMAKMVRKVEDIFLQDGRNIVTSVETRIAHNRRGGQVRENEASVTVEIVAASERDISLNKLLEGWQAQLKELTEFTEIKFQKSRFGSDSGSPIALQIQENKDSLRAKVIDDLKSEMEKLSDLTNVEIEKPVVKYEYRLKIKKDVANRLGVSFDQLGATLRSYIEGDILYILNNGDEEVDVRFTSNDDSIDNVKKVLELTVPNSENYLVPIKNLVDYEDHEKPASIQRVNYKRATMLYADLAKESKLTPLEIAEIIEADIFPKVLAGNPSTNIIFRGEVEDSRESQSDFSLSLMMVLGIIYLLLIFLFNSFWTPFLIGAIIPFGLVGTLLAFWAHGLHQYGFFAVIGTLGMIGVVINDSIVLIDRLNVRLENLDNYFANIATISSTRLRAIVITTLTTVAGLFPTAYGIGGFDSMLSEMMLAMGWGLLFGMMITLVLVPCLYSFYGQIRFSNKRKVEE